MSELNESYSVICRLCTSTKSGQLLIFGVEGENRHLAKKITECLPFQVQAEDYLSKSICQTCMTKVEEFYLFLQSCVRAQSVLKEGFPKYSSKTEVTNSETAETVKILERLQADGSALSITPVFSAEFCKSDQDGDINNSNAFSITPIVHHSESSGDDDSQWESQIFHSLPHLKNPCSEDYVLMREETFKVDPSRLVRQDLVEFSRKYDEFASHKDRDVIDAQLQRKVVLPPMWDVYERSADKENVTHRRYVVSKNSFPCSLCGSCVAFHHQQSVLLKKQGQTLQEAHQNRSDLSNTKQEPTVEKNIMDVQDEQSDNDQQRLRDLEVSNFSSQEVGMLDCPECGKVFPRRSSWKRHLRTHYDGRAFVCPVCGKGFNRKEHLSRHMISHTGGRPFRCDTCFKPFTRKEHLARHLACNVGCSNNTTNLVQGIDQDYTTPRPYACDVCYQTFVRKEHMSRHRKRAHLLMEGIFPPPLLDDDTPPFSVPVIKMEAEDHSSAELDIFPSHINNRDNLTDGPEQIEVEVNLLEDSDEDSVEDLPLSASLVDAFNRASETNHKEFYADEEDTELEAEDMVWMKMNEAMRHARGEMHTPDDQFRCEVCLKKLTGKVHLVRHLRRFHPKIEFAYAATFNKGKATDENPLPDTAQPESSGHQSMSRQDDDEVDDDENGSNPFTIVNNSSVYASRSKGGQHPCSICGKMFGRRYHLVRHRRTQHGVESVEAGRIGRPPKCLLPLAHQHSPVHPQKFRCVACGLQFSQLSDFQSHSCSSNNNNINRKIGSTAVAAMAAKISDKLLKGKGNCDHVCQTCGEKFYNKLELDKHVETHVKDLMQDMLWT